MQTTAVAAGPGLGQSNTLTKLVLWLYQSALSRSCSMRMH
jgi:hypothetical protein